MKYEPLKGKVLLWNQITGDIETTDGKYFLETKTEDAKFFRIFLKKDVKSAVQGLLEEIDKLPTETIYDKIAETRDGMAIAPFEFIKKMSVIDLIKKWFPDVAEGEE